MTGVGLVNADGILLLADLVKHSEYLKPILKPSVISLTKYSASRLSLGVSQAKMTTRGP